MPPVAGKTIFVAPVETDMARAGYLSIDTSTVRRNSVKRVTIKAKSGKGFSVPATFFSTGEPAVYMYCADACRCGEESWVKPGCCTFMGYAGKRL
jgi:hypothetical protein